MQHTFADSFAQHRQAELLREAEMARLAGLATRAAGHQGFLAKAIAAAGRLVIGETGVATRPHPASPRSAPGHRSPAAPGVARDRDAPRPGASPGPSPSL